MESTVTTSFATDFISITAHQPSAVHLPSQWPMEWQDMPTRHGWHWVDSGHGPLKMLHVNIWEDKFEIYLDEQCGYIEIRPGDYLFYGPIPEPKRLTP